MDDAALAARILAKTNEYLDFPSVVGHETPFLDHLARDFTSLGLPVTRRQNLAVVDAGASEPIFAAHVDRHGAIIDWDGAARYAAFAVKNDKYGETSQPAAAFVEKVRARYRGEEMYAYDRRTGGRIAYGWVADVRHCPQTRRLVFDFDGLPRLAPETPVALARALDRRDGPYVSGQLDNPISAAVLRVAVELGLKGRVVFTAEEEIGRSASHFLGWASEALGETKDLFVLDTSPFPDPSEADKGAVVLRRRDATAPFAETAVARAEAAVRAAGAPALFKDAYVEAANAKLAADGKPPQSLGLTELGKIIQLSRGRITGATLQVPTFGYHSNNETTSAAAIVHLARAAIALGG